MARLAQAFPAPSVLGLAALPPIAAACERCVRLVWSSGTGRGAFGCLTGRTEGMDLRAGFRARDPLAGTVRRSDPPVLLRALADAAHAGRAVVCLVYPWGRLAHESYRLRVMPAAAGAARGRAVPLSRSPALRSSKRT